MTWILWRSGQSDASDTRDAWFESQCRQKYFFVVILLNKTIVLWKAIGVNLWQESHFPGNRTNKKIVAVMCGWLLPQFWPIVTNINPFRGCRNSVVFSSPEDALCQFDLTLANRKSLLDGLLKVYLVSGKNLKPLLQILNAIGKIFIVVTGQILQKHSSFQLLLLYSIRPMANLVSKICSIISYCASQLALYRRTNYKASVVI